MSLKNEVVVFTGTLNSMTRKQAQAVVASLKGTNQNSVTGKTSLLVMGSYQEELLEDKAESLKLREAKRLREKGASIQLLNEKEFLKLLATQFHLLYSNL